MSVLLCNLHILLRNIALSVNKLVSVPTGKPKNISLIYYLGHMQIPFCHNVITGKLLAEGSWVPRKLLAVGSWFPQLTTGSRLLVSPVGYWQ